MNLEITEEKIRSIIADKLPIWLEKTLSSDYSNPLKDAIDAELKEKEGIIRTIVREIVASAFTDPKVKEMIAQQVIGKLVEKGLGRN